MKLRAFHAVAGVLVIALLGAAGWRGKVSREERALEVGMAAAREAEAEARAEAMEEARSDAAEESRMAALSEQGARDLEALKPRLDGVAAEERLMRAREAVRKLEDELAKARTRRDWEDYEMRIAELEAELARLRLEESRARKQEK